MAYAKQELPALLLVLFLLCYVQQRIIFGGYYETDFLHR